MKQISTSLATQLKKDSVVERDYIIFKGETTKHYIWFNLYDDCYKDGNFIGTFVLKRIELTYNDSDLEFKNKEFNAYKEYKLDNGTWEAINYGTFIVTEVKPSDTKEEVSVTAYDYGLKFANPYKTELDYSSGNITLKDVLQEVCTKCDVELATQTFTNSTFIVDSNQFMEGTYFGNVISAVAGISCNFGKIKNDNKLHLEFNNQTNIVINTKDYEELEDKRDTQPYNAVTLGVSAVEGENVSLIAEGVEPENAKYLVINDNPFAYTEEKRTQLIQAIFDKINGFGYSSFVLKNCLYPQFECGDLIQIKNKEGQSINTIVLRQSFEETICNFEAPSTISSTVKYAQPLSAVDLANRAEIKVDKQNQVIESVVFQTTQQNQKIAQITQTVEELNSKISDIADITVSAEDTDAKVELDNINVSEPIRIVVRPIGENISYLYPRSNLYPSSNLFSKNRKIRFHNLTTDENFDYELPSDLLYYNSETYDEFILDYDGQSCVINKKVGYNADGTTYALSQTTTISYDYPKIELTDGDYKIELLGYSNAYIFVRLMAQNIYTTQFATRAEVSSQINQTTEEINLVVRKKVNQDEVISTINLTSEQSKIEANKISLEGLITANGNIKILEDGSIEVNNGTFQGDIYLPSGGKVIGGDGLLTNLQFLSNTKFSELGFYSLMSDEANYRSQVVINAQIPANFTITSAKVTLIHSPVKWHDGYSGATFWGRSQNIRLYKTNNISNMYFELYANSDGGFLNEESKSEIANAFSGGYFTAVASSDSYHPTQTIETVDISAHLTTGLNRITLQSADSIPTYTGNYSTDISNTYSKTGYVIAILNVYGYTAIN